MLNALSSQLTSILTESVIYLTVESDLTDFRKNTPPKLKVNTSTKSITIDLPKPDSRMGSLVGLLSVSLFAPKNVVIGWNLKDLFSWLRFHSGVPMSVAAKVFDLKLIEAFSDEYKAKPATYEDAVSRLRAHLSRDEVLSVNKIYSPLLTTVIPAIETSGIVTQDPPCKVYSSYTIEGQANGRLNSGIPFSGSFNPHNLTDETKNNFYPGMDRTFLAFDFCYLEVILLHWITKDEGLGKIIKSGEDVYGGLYKQIFGAAKCSSKNRGLMKKVFIQVIYGIQANSLSEQIGISVNGAQSLIDKILETFPKAFGHLNEIVEKAKSGVVVDVMGRKSVYDKKPPYTARNAVIQAPAAMVCLEKLCDLYGLMLPELTIVASIHDACICTAPKATALKLAKTCADVLKSESKLAPGLCLDVTTKIGEKWGDAQTIIFDETNEEEL